MVSKRGFPDRSRGKANWRHQTTFFRSTGSFPFHGAAQSDITGKAIQNIGILQTNMIQNRNY
jgi:hypothetical protein